MSYPRLAERFGRRYSWKMMLNPRSNINERCHAVVGDCNSRSRETYFRGWKRSLQKRVKPTRQQPIEGTLAALDDPTLTVEPGCSVTDPKLTSLSEKVAVCLSKVRTPQLSEFITVGSIIGAGVEGVVRPGVKKANCSSAVDFKAVSDKIANKILAVKTVEKKGTDGYSSASNCREVNVMSKLCINQHPNITPYLYTFESPVRFHIVTEYNQGGDLFTYLQEHDFEAQSEKDAARVAMQLFCAVQFVHENGYAHLDLKLENVMRRNKGPKIDEGGVCLIDFGHASKLSVGASSDEFIKLSRPVGSPSYAAPEIVLEKKYCAKSDSWSLGVMTYILVQGFLPFPHLQQKKWREFSLNDYGNFDKHLCENDPFYFEGDWEDLSHEVKDLLEKLITVDAAKRITVEDAINHPWFEKMGVRMVRNELGMPVMEEVEEHGHHDSLKDAQSSTSRLFSWV